METQSKQKLLKYNLIFATIIVALLGCQMNESITLEDLEGDWTAEKIEIISEQGNIIDSKSKIFSLQINENNIGVINLVDTVFIFPITNNQLIQWMEPIIDNVTGLKNYYIIHHFSVIEDPNLNGFKLIANENFMANSTSFNKEITLILNR